MPDAEITSTPLKRRWGLGLAFAIFALAGLGFGVGDFFDRKVGPGLVLLLMGGALTVASIVAFRIRFRPPPPEPALARWRWVAAVGAGILTGLAFPICFPFFSHHEQLPSGVLEIFAWIGLVPLLAAIDGVSPRRAMLLGFLAGMAFFNTTFWWVNVAMTTFGGIPDFLSVPVLELLVAWCAFHWALATGAVAFIRRRLGWPLWLVAPAAWAAAELLRNYFMSGFPWANLGYATARDLWFSQVASLGGVYLIAFALVQVNAALYQLGAWLRRRDRRFPAPAVGLALLVMLGGHLFGALRVRALDARLATAPKVKVALIQGNIDQKIKSHHESYFRFILDQYLPQTDQADDAGADLIIWPEAAFPGYFPPGALSLHGRGLDRARYRAHLLLGVQTANMESGRSSNSAYWVDPDLTMRAQYDKHHLVPFGEYVLWNLDRYLPIGPLIQDVGLFEPGRALPIWDIKLGEAVAGQGAGQPEREAKVGMLICYDAIFPEIARDYARRDVDLLVNITNDAWYGFSSAPYQFLRMVELRAIESGRAVARAANTGISAFIDPAGRIVEQTGLGLVDDAHDTVSEAMHVPPTRLAREVPLLRAPTIYAEIGDLFAYLCAALVGVGLLLAIRVQAAPASVDPRALVD